MFYPTSFGKEPIKSAEPLPNKLGYDCRLKKTGLGEFYLKKGEASSWHYKENQFIFQSGAKQILLHWFGCARWTYNQCLASVKTDGNLRTQEALRSL